MAIDAVIDSWTPPKFRDGDLASLLCARVCVCARGLGRAWGVRVCASVCVCAGRRGRGGGGLPGRLGGSETVGQQRGQYGLHWHSASIGAVWELQRVPA